MPSSKLSIRFRLGLAGFVTSVALAAGTYAAFQRFYEPLILLRRVQAGQAPPHTPTLDTLTEAATQSFKLKERYEVIDVLESQKNYQSTDAVLRSINDQNVDALTREDVLIRLARNAANAGWFVQSAERYRRYLSIKPQDHTARGEMAGILLQAGQKDASIRAYQHLTETDPNPRRWLLRLADAALSEKTPNATPEPPALAIAEEALLGALRLKDEPSTRGKLAIVYCLLLEHDKALDTLRPCGPIPLRDTETCLAFAQAMAHAATAPRPSEIDHATALAELALDSPSTDTRVLAALARAMRRLEQPERAVKLFEKTVGQAPRHRSIRYELANLLHDQGRFVEADVHYTLLLEQFEQDPSSADDQT